MRGARRCGRGYFQKCLVIQETKMSAGGVRRRQRDGGGVDSGKASGPVFRYWPQGFGLVGRASMEAPRAAAAARGAAAGELAAFGWQ